MYVSILTLYTAKYVLKPWKPRWKSKSVWYCLIFFRHIMSTCILYGTCIWKRQILVVKTGSDSSTPKRSKNRCSCHRSSEMNNINSHGDIHVKNFRVGQKKFLTSARHSWPLSNDGSLACHTYCDTGHPFIMFISEDPWDSHLLLSI